MNTVDKWLTTATIHDHSRRELWSQVFPGGVVPIKSIMPQKVNVPERGNVDAYMLDLDALSHVQMEGTIRVISQRFNIPIEEVRGEIKQGVPILADGVSVCSADQGLFFSLIDDEENLFDEKPFERERAEERDDWDEEDD